MISKIPFSSKDGIFDDFFLLICWSLTKSRSSLKFWADWEIDVGIQNQNNSLITGEAGLENVAWTWTRETFLSSYALNCIYQLGPGKATIGQAIPQQAYSMQERWAEAAGGTQSF